MIAARRVSAITKGTTMLFAVFDHNDATGLPPARQLDERLELVAAYERLGYYAYQLAEHHGTPLGIATPHLMLAAASRLTSTIKLGTLISILTVVPPLRMVEEAATLDQLSNGRLVLGVGRGVSPIEIGFHGVPEDEAQPRFDEAFEILRMGLSSDVVDFHGTYYDISAAPVATRPVQQPLIPWYATRTARPRTCLAGPGWAGARHWWRGSSRSSCSPSQVSRSPVGSPASTRSSPREPARTRRG